MRCTACMVRSSGAINRAAWPAKKINAATTAVMAIRLFIGVPLSLLYQKIAQKPRSCQEHNIKSSEECDPGGIKRGLLGEKQSGGLDRGNEQRRKNGKEQKGQQQLQHARVGG